MYKENGKKKRRRWSAEVLNVSMAPENDGLLETETAHAIASEMQSLSTVVAPVRIAPTSFSCDNALAISSLKCVDPLWQANTRNSEVGAAPVRHDVATKCSSGGIVLRPLTRDTAVRRTVLWLEQWQPTTLSRSTIERIAQLAVSSCIRPEN